MAYSDEGRRLNGDWWNHPDHRTAGVWYCHAETSIAILAFLSAPWVVAALLRLLEP